ncbi:MAG: IS110 family transposase [Luteitalea sp.]|nr:IS110 family transposase [Luteitalea sp.]
MDVMHQRCAGLAVHKDEVVACARVVAQGRVTRTAARFPTTTRGLLALSDWLTAQRIPIAVLEATGVYWKPVWHILEASVELVLANAAHVRAVPGRKTDMNDATWLADLLAHGLIRGSFVPPAPIQALRDLTRTRKQLVRQVAQHTQRLQKTLEDANIKITGLVSDLLGVSGRALLTGLIAGETDPDQLLARTTGKLRAEPARLRDALQGRVTAHHRFLLQLHLDQIRALEAGIQTIDARLQTLVAPFRPLIEHLCTMPGVSTVVAQTLLAELGTDMARFPTSAHVVSWAGLCPRLDESAGKRRSTRVRHGAPWLKTVMVQAAWAAVRRRDSYPRAQFHRLKARRGPKKALVAVAASLLTVAYVLLRDQVDYRDLGPHHVDALDKGRAARRLTRRLEALGFTVTLNDAA